MNLCQHCKRPTQNYLCDDCTTSLTNMLDQIPWLLDELDNRIQRLDTISAGTIGRNRSHTTPFIIDFDAAELARTIRKKLSHWVTKVAQQATGRTPPALNTISTPNLAKWLQANTNHIAHQPHANQLYNDIKHLVGPDQQRTGQLVRAINPTEQHLVGPCPTITGRNHNGTPRQCGHTLFADTYDQTVTCPTCKQDIDVETTRRHAAETRDLQTKTELIDILTNIDEPVQETRIEQWIKARRLRPRGYLHDSTIIEFQIDPDDQPVYSVERARKLRRRDSHLRTRTRTARRA